MMLFSWYDDEVKPQPSTTMYHRRLRRWYRITGRDLPWRRTRDPYRIAVSEVMLQQTQVDRVIPKYRAWIRRWPTATALSRASLSEIMKLWIGLGYNRRAKMLRDAAQIVVSEYGGRWPTDVETLRNLPGFGPYTAAAVAVFSGQVRTTMIDTNVRRVIGRWRFGVRAVDDVNIRTAANELLPPTKADEWHHALMDLGATICTAKPKCQACPVRTLCAAYPKILKVRPIQRPIQMRFADSQRYVRGRIVAILTGSPMTEQSLIGVIENMYGLERTRVRAAIRSLIKDRMIKHRKNGIQLSD